MKPITITAKKVKNGYLIPPNPILEKQGKGEINLEIKIIKAKEKPEKKKTYKELRDEALWEKYLEKEKRKVPSRISTEKVDEFSMKHGLDAENIDDLLRLK